MVAIFYDWRRKGADSRKWRSDGMENVSGQYGEPFDKEGPALVSRSRVVAHTGFEPVISSLRGRCPRPLDECAKRISLKASVYYPILGGPVNTMRDPQRKKGVLRTSRKSTIRPKVYNQAVMPAGAGRVLSGTTKGVAGAKVVID